MAISVPQMQTAYTGYDFGQNTARNLLDAVRMRNQRDMQERQLRSDYELQQRRLRSAEGMQGKRLRSAEGMQKERLGQSQTQFDDDLTFRRTGQDASIKSQLELDAIRRAQEARAKSEFDTSLSDKMGRSDILRKQVISEKKIDTLGKNVNEALNDPSVNVKTINKNDSILTKGSNMFNEQAYNLYNLIYPSSARDRYSKDFGLNQAVTDRSNINYSNNPNIIYTQDTYEADRGTPDNFLNQVMINSNY